MTIQSLSISLTEDFKILKIVSHKLLFKKISKFTKLDVACAIPHDEGFAYFNYFWVNSEYVKNFCKSPEINKNRFVWEFWIGNKNCSKDKVNTFSPIKIDPPITNEDYRLTHKQVNEIYNKMFKQIV